MIIYSISFVCKLQVNSISKVINSIISDLKILFLLSLFILFLTTIFFNKCYFHNILRNTLTIKFMWKVITSSNLNPPLKLFFYSAILIDNNLLLKIYCEIIIVAFLN